MKAVHVLLISENFSSYCVSFLLEAWNRGSRDLFLPKDKSRIVSVVG